MVKNPKFCEIQKNYNMLKDVCWKRMLKTHVEYANATFKKISFLIATYSAKSKTFYFFTCNVWEFYT